VFPYCAPGYRLEVLCNALLPRAGANSLYFTTFTDALSQILFVLTNASCAVIFFLFYPETKGKSLEEIDEIFGDVQHAIRESDLLNEKAGLETTEIVRQSKERV
jgi:hypothetical protein